MTERHSLQILREAGVLLTDGHFVLASGRHASTYVAHKRLNPKTLHVAKLCRGIAEHFACYPIEVVVGPAYGGITLAAFTAYHLSSLRGRGVANVYAKKTEGSEKSFALDEAFREFVAGKNTLVVEDIATTGGSVKSVVEAVTACGGKVLGAGLIWNRGGVDRAGFGLAADGELFSLINKPLDSWEATECPQCAKGVPINTVHGHGTEFLAKGGENGA